MTAFICHASEDAICLLTTGASYDRTGKLISVGRQVETAKAARFAAFSRGNVKQGESINRALCAAADRAGVDVALEAFAEVLPGIVPEPGFRGLDTVHWIVAGWSETRGPVAFQAHNATGEALGGLEPFRLHRIAGAFAAGTELSPEARRAAGVEPVRGGESWPDYFERQGGNLMEAMRLHRGEAPADHDRADFYSIGGQVDLTVITSAGLTVKTLRVWDDAIGEKIDPFRTEKIVPLTRRARRAAASVARAFKRRAG